MKCIYARNVNDAYVKGLAFLREKGERSASRAGDVLVSPVPVTTVYKRPTERVLFDAQRDANPFFHLFESLWMLYGSNDGRWLDQFVSDFSQRFGEPDGIIHDAYGHRWRTSLGVDQLDVVVGKLKKNPNDRQAVIQMWDARFVGSDDLLGDWNGRPCNTHIYLRVRVDDSNNYIGAERIHPRQTLVLDLTVCCRSNDIIWGAYGANAVHFSVLQEYLAARIGVGVGTMYQISNNYHAYITELEKVGIPASPEFPQYPVEYPYPLLIPLPSMVMVTDPEMFDLDLTRFMDWTRNYEHGQGPNQYTNDWFSSTAEPLFAIAERWRAKDRDTAMSLIDDPVFNIAPDWRAATKAWMQRRLDRMAKVKGT